MRTVSAASVAASEERNERLPRAVAEALGELAGAAKDGLLGAPSAWVAARLRAGEAMQFAILGPLEVRRDGGSLL